MNKVLSCLIIWQPVKWINKNFCWMIPSAIKVISEIHFPFPRVNYLKAIIITGCKEWKSHWLDKDYQRSLENEICPCSNPNNTLWSKTVHFHLINWIKVPCRRLQKLRSHFWVLIKCSVMMHRVINLIWENVLGANWMINRLRQTVSIIRKSVNVWKKYLGVKKWKYMSTLRLSLKKYKLWRS